MDAQQLRVTVLEKLQTALGDAPTLAPLSDERYDRTHEHFERSSDQQPKIYAWLENFVRSHFRAADPLKILSVGCGSGILDNRLIQSLAVRSKQIRYTGIDPNSVACHRFRSDFHLLGLRNVQLDVREQIVESIEATEGFHLIHAVHSLYYFSDPAATLESIRRLLHPGGKLIVVQAPRAEMNQLADCFWLHHAVNDIWFSGRLAQHLEQRGIRYARHPIHASVNVTRCFEAGCPRGEMLLDFITQTDCRQFDDEILELCRGYLRAVSHSKDDRHSVAHPADVFVIDAPHDVAPTAG